MFEDVLDIFKPKPKSKPTDSKVGTPKDNGKQILINAATYLVQSYTGKFEEDWFENTQDFPNGHIISRKEADHYEALHILSCLVTGRELCFNNVKVTQAWVDEAVENWMQEFDPIPHNISLKKAFGATAGVDEDLD